MHLKKASRRSSGIQTHKSHMCHRTCIHVPHTYTHPYLQVCRHSCVICTHTSAHICTHRTCMHAHTRIHTQCPPTHTCVCTPTHPHSFTIYTDTCVHTPTHVHAHPPHTCTHALILCGRLHTHTHTQLPSAHAPAVMHTHPKLKDGTWRCTASPTQGESGGLWRLRAPPSLIANPTLTR